MKNLTDEEIYDLALLGWGKTTQLLKLAEECAEANAATLRLVSQYVATEGSLAGLQMAEQAKLEMAEELADVTIMMEQAKRFLGEPFARSVELIKRQKIARLADRLTQLEGKDEEKKIE